MKKIFVLLGVVTTLLFSSYSEGQQISISDQQLSKEVCFASEFETFGYELGDSFSLYDMNGSVNGGNYYVFFIDLSASW